ncbi:hypothetical protein DDF65_06350 [Caulobacter radicis]|uniref:Uncharacterized protein n=2 Tax=Caulobacter radicis TaxID=2172650 RepID=A0A2T9JPW3_9CAUL|nr:hypothetical protein DDF65_06350 [Caulobacter radicis]
MQRFDDGDGEYVVFSEEALQFLPKEWRDELQAQLDDSRGVLKTVDKELSALSRLSTSLVDMVTLKYVQGRLTAFRFSPTMAAVLELDMLTTAFVVTYARLQQGGGGTLPCLDERYAAGMSLWHHRKVQEWARLKGSAFNTETQRILARAQLIDRIEESAPHLRGAARNAMRRLLTSQLLGGDKVRLKAHERGQ